MTHTKEEELLEDVDREAWLSGDPFKWICLKKRKSDNENKNKKIGFYSCLLLVPCK
jgi:hypothetical protein